MPRMDVHPTEPGVRKDWEFFWRIIAGLIVIIIAWTIWVLYQITPRPVVTPLAYETRVKPIASRSSASGLIAPPAQQPAAEADVAMDLAQAAARSGAHQSSADTQAASLEREQEQIKGERLKLATEISTPLAARQGNPQTPEAGIEGAPAGPEAIGAGGRGRP